MSIPRRSSRVTTPSSSRPTPIRTPATHHKTADELAAEEAASILHTPTPKTSTPITRLRSAGTSSSSSIGAELENGSARALRHRRLNEVREATQESSGREDSKSISSLNSDGEQEEVDEEEEDDAAHDEHASNTLDHSINTSSTIPDDQNQTQELSPSTGLSTGQTFVTAQSENGNEGNISDDASASDPEDDSDDGSSTVTTSASSNTSDSEDDSEDDSDEEERMDKLLQAAKAAAIAKQNASDGQGKGKVDNQEEDENVLDFDEDQKEKKKDAPIPDLSVPRLPKAHLSFTQDGKAQAYNKLPELGQAGPSRRPLDTRKKDIPVPELDDRPYERELSKREKAAQPRKATTSELWSSIPTPRSDLLPQMKKDYQALALANSLDPKRFMKGGSRSDKVPESFAIGTMIDAPRHMRDTTLTKERKYRAGQVVKSLIQDDTTGEYAKRKYGDLQWNRMENGRGKGWKKTKKW
ncbi:uncharacterized protein I303_105471 [Kwoniella dejecticola CBS 10117]|uniref:Fcf2 pre-rRNA processing C-terminal domain-containing protein n=1 Tax=Kwoniella dejecticola CBS 10117 TaxID=1296121 RepID=A0A1A6A2E2_9TREE|nr:uncharacterized protein I303_05087 [Kwoniella dejecticola CBS 10117]OBR84230.1 hypothetical protein I303_05087 [Kwoniella dejecticola CBS 10117]